MARPRSEDKRTAILDAAARVVVDQGLGAPTATIARQAGVANGTLFTYFPTKVDLFNHLYLDLKTSMATAAFHRYPAAADLRSQTLHIWTHWMGWAVAHPEKRRALALLGVSEDITPATREAGHTAMAGIAQLMEQVRLSGAMRTVARGLVMALMNSLAEATMDYMVQEPAQAKKHCKAGFEAMWRMLG